MVRSLDNSDGTQYYGGNDPKKMSGRFKKGGSGGGTRLLMNVKGLNKRGIKKKTGKLLRDIRNNKIAIATIQGKGKRAYTRVKGEKTLFQKRAMTSGDISRNASIQSARLERQGQLNLFK